MQIYKKKKVNCNFKKIFKESLVLYKINNNCTKDKNQNTRK